MKKRGVWILIAIALKVIGLIILIGSLKMTGNVIGESLGKTGGSIVGIAFIIGGLVMLGATLEKRVRERVRSGKELQNAGWTNKDLTFRKKITNLLQHPQTKAITMTKIAEILPRYKTIEDTGDYVGEINPMKVFEGRTYDGKKEYFSIDDTQAHSFELNFGKNGTNPAPRHIDIQKKVGNHQYKKDRPVQIPWKEYLSQNQDVLNAYHITIDEMLKNYHPEK